MLDGHEARVFFVFCSPCSFLSGSSRMLHQVFVVDNYFTGRKRNIEQWLGHENFEMLHHDIVNPLFIEVTIVSAQNIYISSSPRLMRYTTLPLLPLLLTTCTTL